MQESSKRRIAWLMVLVAHIWSLSGPADIGAQDAPQSKPLKVAATVPDLGSLLREIGGEQVDVTVFAKGTEDPHFVVAKPSFIKVVSQADVFAQMGMDMEVGWAPLLLQQARNARVIPGAPGFIDASEGVAALGLPTGTIDRSMGDVHLSGNPHFLLDPIEGLRVAQLIRDRLSVIRPGHAATFEQHFATFQQRLGEKLVGRQLAQKYDVAKLALLFEHGRLVPFLTSQNEASLLGGWLGQMVPLAGSKAVGDHDMWRYFARRFRLQLIGYMEPRPGVPPTTRHLRDLIKTMQTEDVELILTGAYYDPRHARFLANHTQARVAELAHEVGAQQGTGDYLGMIDYNVNKLVSVYSRG